MEGDNPSDNDKEIRKAGKFYDMRKKPDEKPV